MMRTSLKTINIGKEVALEWDFWLEIWTATGKRGSNLDDKNCSDSIILFFILL
jgi:hypothetical protein